MVIYNSDANNINVIKGHIANLLSPFPTLTLHKRLNCAAPGITGWAAESDSRSRVTAFAVEKKSKRGRSFPKGVKFLVLRTLAKQGIQTYMLSNAQRFGLHFLKGRSWIVEVNGFTLVNKCHSLTLCFGDRVTGLAMLYCFLCPNSCSGKGYADGDGLARLSSSSARLVKYHTAIIS